LVIHSRRFPTVAEGSRFQGVWESSFTDEADIATGDADRVMLGAVAGDDDPGEAVFHFFDVVTKKMAARKAWRTPDGSAPTLDLELKLVSVPAIAGGPKTYELALTDEVMLYGEKPTF
jgi:hypothetical protein